jgi:hypothetical protein
MRKHAVRALTIAAAGAALTGIAVPAFAWTYVGSYPTKFKCVDAGQTYQREGWDYSCRYRPAGDWVLFIE